MSHLPAPQRSWAIRQIISLVDKNKRVAVQIVKHSTKILTLNDLEFINTKTNNSQNGKSPQQ